MKSILEIQQDIRKLEKSVGAISNDIKSINSDLNELRNSFDISMIDFNAIESLAHNLPFNTHPLRRLQDGRQCQIYLEMLLNIVRLDKNQEATINRMIFIQWLQEQAQIDWSLKDLYIDTIENGKERLYEIVDGITKEYKAFLALDILLVSYISGATNEDIQEYIADIFSILDVDYEQIIELGTIAKFILCQKMMNFTDDQVELILDRRKKYSCYFTAKSIKPGIEQYRTIILEVPNDNVVDLKWYISNCEKVEKGDVVVTYKKKKKTYVCPYVEFIPKTIIASKNGVFYRFKHNKKLYGVIFHEADSVDSVKEWVKEIKG